LEIGYIALVNFSWMAFPTNSRKDQKELHS